MKTIRKYGILFACAFVISLFLGSKMTFAETLPQVQTGDEANQTGCSEYEGIAPLALDDEIRNGWVEQEGITCYYRDGKKLQNSWLLDGGEWYWFREDGSMSTDEFITVRGALYRTGNTGAIFLAEWFEIDGDRYYADNSGALCRSSLKWEGRNYYFDSVTGKMTSTDPYWYLRDGRYRYCKSNGQDAVHEWILHSGCWYFFDEDGWMYSSTFFFDKNNLYYARSWGGIYCNQFFTVDGSTYYARDWGGLYRNGSYSIQGKTYAFDENGAVIQTEVFIKRPDGEWIYRKADGKLAACEWIYYKSYWYYFDEDGVMYHDCVFDVEGKKYCARSWGGVYKNTWIKEGEHTYYADSSGALAVNWLKIDGIYYFADENGEILKNQFITWKNIKYYLGQTGAMMVGWMNINGHQYYFQSWGGAYADTTVKIGSKYYAFDEEGILITDNQLANTADGQYVVTDAVTGKKTVENFLRCALMPVGRTLYIWGGGHEKPDLGLTGVNPNWAAFFQANDETYDDSLHEYEYGNGLDCSGYVGWAVFQVMQETCTIYSTKTPETLQNHGWGYVDKASGKFYPGDIVARSGHVWIVLGQCQDGSVVVMHATDKYVQIGGTVTPGGSSDSEAIKLADEYMSRYYPVAFGRYGVFRGKTNYLSDPYLMRFHFSESVMPDVKKIQSMTPQQVLAMLFNETEG